MAQHEVEPAVEESFMPPADQQTPMQFETPIEPTIVGDIPQEVPEYQAPPEEPYLAPADEIPAGSEFQVHGEAMPANEYGQLQESSDFHPQFEAPAAEANAGLELVSDVSALQPEPEIDDYDFNQALGQPVPQPMHSLTPDSADFSDVEAFANANAASGPLSYVVIIDDIDSSHLLKQLREAMTDSRFGWDVNALTSNMAGGRLILSGLSPAKASVLINRIKYLPFKISWRQDVLSSS